MLAKVSLSVQDECSFVSLRDVERAMIVFKYEKMDIFGPLIDKKQKNDEEVTVEDENYGDEIEDDELLVLMRH